MASGIYDKAREQYLGGSLNWTSDTVKAVLVTSGYTPNFASDQFLSSITAANRVATTAALTGKTATAGVAGAANTVFPAAPAGKVGVAVVLYKDTGSDASSNLIAYIDSASSGLPVTANGGDINLLFGTGPNKIFKL